MKNTINENSDSRNIECREVTVYCPLTQQILVTNEAAVPLLKALWSLDMFVIAPCAHDLGRQLCLEFNDRDDVEFFLWHICRAIGKIEGAPANLRERMFGMHPDQDASDDQLDWMYNAEVYDLAEESDAKKNCQEKWPFDILVAIDVIFPRSDYDFVLHAIQNEVEACRRSRSINERDTKASDASEE